jgi:hypothetical protein
MRTPPTHLKVNREALPKIHAQEPGVRGLMDMGLYLALLDLAAHQGTPTVTVSLHQLAPILGICRNSLARSIRRLESAGAILTAPQGSEGMAIVFQMQT